MIKNKGYYIEKANYTEDDIKKIKEELTVMPKVLEFGAKPAQDSNDEEFDPDADKKYKLYTNTKKYLILPRFYGQSKFGKTEIKIKPFTKKDNRMEFIKKRASLFNKLVLDYFIKNLDAFQRHTSIVFEKIDCGWF